MKKVNFLNRFLIAGFLFITACSSSATKNIDTKMHVALAGSGKILIVYLSRTGNTGAVAEMIQKNVGGTLAALELQNPYPENYQAIVQQVVHENETGFLPVLKTKIDSLEKYNVIFLGFPTWDMKIPPPMKSFLHQYDLTGKTIIPFNTNAGYGVGTGFQTIKELCPNSIIKEGLELKGGIEKEGVLFVMTGKKAEDTNTKIIQWLQKIEIMN